MLACELSARCVDYPTTAWRRSVTDTTETRADPVSLLPPPRPALSLKTLFAWLLWPLFDAFIGPFQRPDGSWPRWILLTPNALSFSRALIIPAAPLLTCQAITFNAPGAWTLLWIELALVATDAVDGPLARYIRHETDLGAFIDPLLDKASGAAMYLSWLWLLWVFYFPLVWPVAIMVLLRVAADVRLAKIARQEQLLELHPKAGPKGKIKACADAAAHLVVAVCYVLIAQHHHVLPGMGIAIACVLVALVFSRASIREHQVNLARHQP
jgi:phosphatidylglycerophosphate synthase